jgi:hypothetical protein
MPDEEAEDMATANMLLVCGWSQPFDVYRRYVFAHCLCMCMTDILAPPAKSQTDTPSLEGGSQSSEVDELFALTPPQQPFLKSSNYFMGMFIAK